MEKGLLHIILLIITDWFFHYSGEFFFLLLYLYLSRTVAQIGEQHYSTTTKGFSQGKLHGLVSEAVDKGVEERVQYGVQQSHPFVDIQGGTS